MPPKRPSPAKSAKPGTKSRKPTKPKAPAAPSPSVAPSLPSHFLRAGAYCFSCAHEAGGTCRLHGIQVDRLSLCMEHPAILAAQTRAQTPAQPIPEPKPHVADAHKTPSNPLGIHNGCYVKLRNRQGILGPVFHPEVLGRIGGVDAYTSAKFHWIVLPDRPRKAVMGNDIKAFGSVFPAWRESGSYNDVPNHQYDIVEVLDQSTGPAIPALTFDDALDFARRCMPALVSATLKALDTAHVREFTVYYYLATKNINVSGNRILSGILDEAPLITYLKAIAAFDPTSITRKDVFPHG